MTSTPDPRPSRRCTTRVLLLIPALALLAWSGSSWNPRLAIPWTFTKDGWLAPAPGLAFLWFSAALLFALLSAIAYQLFQPRPAALPRRFWPSACLILLLALAARLVIARFWIPLPLNPAALAAKSLPSIAPLHAFAVTADLLIIAVLLFALRRAGKSPWWAALYALHPLALIEIAGNAHWIPFAIAPLIVLAAIAHLLPRWARLLIASLVAFAAVATIAFTASQPPFNSFAADLLADLGPANRAILPALAALLQAAILLLSLRRNWPLPRTLSHLALVFLLCCPIVQPWYVLPLIALAPLAWNRAAWVLSLLVLAAYVAVPILRSGQPWHLPAWLLMLEWIPIIVLEAQELLAESLSPRTGHAAPSAATATSLPLPPEHFFFRRET